MIPVFISINIQDTHVKITSYVAAKLLKTQLHFSNPYISISFLPVLNKIMYSQSVKVSVLAVQQTSHNIFHCVVILVMMSLQPFLQRIKQMTV